MNAIGKLLRASLLCAALGSPAFGQLPTGFSNDLVLGGFLAPVSLAFPATDEILVCEQGGNIHLVDLSGQTPVSSHFLTVPDVQLEAERGLIAIVLDPSHALNGWFYVYYYHATTARFRVSRFTRFNDHASPASELIVWQDNTATQECCHHGGGLDFGPDGCLYLTVGEEFLPAQAADLTESGGKVHRFYPDGTIPADNPFVDGAGPNVDTIWATGLRNPFRAKWDLPTGRFFIGEVGGNTQATAREDVHLGAAGVNYGWPNCEGSCSNPAFPTCDCATADDPIFSYDHLEGQAIVGGFVYRGTQFPASYEGAYFYGDYPSQWIRFLTFDAAGTAVTGSMEFEPAAGQVTFLGEGLDGSLIYCHLDGDLRRISYDSGNLAPEIHSAIADVTEGSSPLTVNFTGVASDPEDDLLNEVWDFGDGNQAPGNQVSHTYAQNGVYQARWIVSDAGQTRLSDPIEIRVGVAPTVSIDSPIDMSLFRAGDLISFSGSATDPDGTLLPTDFKWEVFFLHNEHTHPAFGPIFDTLGSFSIPSAGHDFSDDTGYRIVLTVTDVDGLETQTSVEVLPDKVDLTLDTVPTGLTVLFDGLPRTTPFIADTLIGFEHSVRALPSACLGEDAYTFDSWSDGAPIDHLVVVPDVDTDISAKYMSAGSCFVPIDDGLAAWFKADFGVDQTGGVVQSWTDGSVQGNSLVAAGDPTVVENGLGGHDYIAFDGIQDELSRTSAIQGLPAGNADRTMFAVVRYEEVAGGGLGYGTAACNQGFAFSVDGGGNPTINGWCPGNDFSGTATATDAGWMTLSVVYSQGTFGHYKNGLPIDIRSHDFGTLVDRILIGASLDGSQHRQMDLAEFLIYDRALTEVERLDIEDYLQTTYFGQPCGSGDCNGNGIADDCELGNTQKAVRFYYGDWIDSPDFNLPGDFTLETWVNLPAPITEDDALTCRLPGGHEVSFPGGRMRLFSFTDVIIANTPLVPDTWTHVALTREGDVLSIYLDGVLDATGQWDGLFRPQTIGRGRNGARTVGHFDEYRLWEVARSETEIQATMGLALGGPIPGLLGSWRFDNFLIDQTVLDSSGNSLHAVFGTGSGDENIDPSRDEMLVAPVVRADDADLDGILDQCQLGSELCQANVTAAGCTPSIGYLGTPSFSGPDNLRITGVNLPGDVTGYVLIGSAQAGPITVGGVPLGSANARRIGFPNCIEAPKAAASGNTGGTRGTCEGILDLQIGQAALASLGYMPGDTMLVQIVTDDPAQADGTKAHTLALEFTLLP